MTHAILFDLDGTLVDHTSAARAALAAWSPTLGIEPNFERWIELDKWGFARFERGETTHLGQRRDRIRAYLNKELDDATCDTIYSGYLSAYEQNWTAYPDALGALQRAVDTGNPVGILTNGAAPMQQDKLDRTGLSLPGLVMLAASTLDSAKPRPEMYSRALARLGASTATIIGDDWVNDVEKPRSLGWNAIYIDRSGTDPRADIHSLDEILH
ncbi:HAD superfamily hydrolase [Corynebacterium deserti GIMN1.010]|uniref:HAD superfamily hydrolase n=1 Tax=Corynebacterium deserti GIMN1.010 TaxID=931089 RepID=A0A0M3QA72_9CORY|nr:HAD family hydrolase [Corynebacterium deserti]ALC06979.1 HAD superfamily hydrolase [Corynebacterium deserti GIMN1.010]